MSGFLELESRWLCHTRNFVYSRDCAFYSHFLAKILRMILQVERSAHVASRKTDGNTFLHVFFRCFVGEEHIQVVGALGGEFSRCVGVDAA